MSDVDCIQRPLCDSGAMPGAPNSVTLQVQLQDNISRTALSDDSLPTVATDLDDFNGAPFRLFANPLI